MNVKWFKEYADNWAGILTISQESLDAIANDLLLITEMMGGCVFSETAVDEGMAQTHAIRTCSEALNTISRRHAHSLRKGSLGPVYLDVREGEPNDIDFIESSVLRPKLDLNTANHEELEDLPGIGPKTSKRIVKLRASLGTFTENSDLKAAKGIGQAEIDKFSKYVYISRSKRDRSYYSSVTFKEFLNKPVFSKYLELLASHELGPWRYKWIDNPNASIGENVMSEIRNFRLALESWERPRDKRNVGILLEDLVEFEKIEKRCSKIGKKGVNLESDGVLLDDSMYPGFVTKIIASAKSSIFVVMFFAKFEDEPNYPTDPIFEEIVNAHNRGVEVKVVLDTDAEDSLIGSRNINEEAYKYLKNNGISVVYDSPKKFTHTKLVLIDSEHVIVGSHNWTAGSFYAYQDTSIYAQSQQLGALYRKRFKAFWKRYK